LIGQKHSGQSTIASHIAESNSHTLLSYSGIEEELKKKAAAAAGDDGEAGEAIPQADIFNELK
jgi:hypothetical protein